MSIASLTSQEKLRAKKQATKTKVAAKTKKVAARKNAAKALMKQVSKRKKT